MTLEEALARILRNVISIASATTADDFIRLFAEEITDILAARELAKLPPLTMADVDEVRENLARRGILE